MWCGTIKKRPRGCLKERGKKEWRRRIALIWPNRLRSVVEKKGRPKGSPSITCTMPRGGREWREREREREREGERERERERGRERDGE